MLAVNRCKVVADLSRNQGYKKARLMRLMREMRTKANPSLKVALEMRMPLEEKSMWHDGLERLVIDGGKNDRIIPLIGKKAFDDDERVKALECLFVGRELQSGKQPQMTLRQYAELKMKLLGNELRSMQDAKSMLVGEPESYDLIASIIERGRIRPTMEAIGKLLESGSLDRFDRARKVKENAEVRVMKTMLEIIKKEKPQLIIVSRYLGETKVPGYDDMTI